MRKHAIRFLSLVAVLCALCAIFALAACKPDEKTEPKTTGIEISSPPDKVAYYVGDTFDETGMVVQCILDNGEKQVVRDYTIDKTGALTVNDTTVTVSYKGFTATVTITVTEKDTPPDTPVVKELQVLALPAKTVYKDGETFDKTGMEIVYIAEDDSRKPVTDYTVDKTTLTVNDTFVTVSYGGKTVKVNVTVNADKPAREVTDVEIYSGDDLKYKRTTDVSDIIKYKAVYSDGTKDADWTYAAAEDLDSFKVEGENLILEVSLFVKNKEFQKTVNVPIDNNSISVSELLTKTADGETVYQVEGIVMGITSTMAREEYIIKDTQSGSFIGISNILTSGSVTALTAVPRYVKGDKVSLPVTLERDPVQAQYSNSEKLHGIYAGGSIYETGIIESGTELNIDYTGATEISGQAALQDFLSAANRTSNHYKLVKLNGPLNIIRYGDGPNYHYRFFFNDISAKTLAAQKVDNCSPCFMGGNQKYLTEKTVGELLANNKNWAPTTWGTPGVAYKNVYALFIGGNTYYHEFIILEESAVSDMPKFITEVTASAPEKNVYLKDQTLDLTGAAVTVKYNYGANDTVAITTEMLDSSTLPDMGTVGNYTVKGTYEGHEFEFTVSVIEETVQSLSVKGTPKTEYNIGEGYDAVKEELCKTMLEVTFSTNETRDVAITEGMLSCDDEWTLGGHKVTISYLGESTELDITVVQPDVTVTQIKALGAGKSVYNLTGVVVSSAYISGTASSPANGEIMLKDKDNSNIIGLKGLVTKESTLGGLDVGDEIKVQVTLVVTSTTSSHSENGKIAATIVENTQPEVLSKGNSVALDLSTAVELNSQADIQAFLQDAETRSGNAYKLVKLTKDAHLTNYSGSLYISYEGTATADIKVDGLSPFLHTMNQSMTLGEQTYVDLLFGEAPETNTLSSPAQLVGDVYLLYIGGQGIYYHQFILLGADYVVTAEVE